MFNGCKFGNVKVGIIGYTTEETPDISDTGTLVFNDVVETVRTESERLRTKEWRSETKGQGLTDGSYAISLLRNRHRNAGRAYTNCKIFILCFPGTC